MLANSVLLSEVIDLIRYFLDFIIFFNSLTTFLLVFELIILTIFNLETLSVSVKIDLLAPSLVAITESIFQCQSSSLLLISRGFSFILTPPDFSTFLL